MSKFIFTWDNLRYSVKESQTSIWRRRKSQRIIIDGVSGFAFSGTLTAIMGASGCGKTTLLTLLSGQRRGKGILKINGRVVTGKVLRSNSTFLQQKDIFVESLTVNEHMTFMAAMWLLKPYSARIVTINKLLKDLNIENIRYTRIQFLSTGEKRKLSLASNLLLEPYILFCDEPTTGLDSYSAISMMRILESVAVSGRIVLLTIHQPSSQLFDFFDKIILLSTNGKVVFQGSKDNAKIFFESQFLFCPSSYNPADFYINITAGRSHLDEKKIEKLVQQFEEEYSMKFNFLDFDCHGLMLKTRIDQKHFFYMLGWLVWRIFIDMKRHTRQYFTSFILIMVTSFVIGATYSSTKIQDSNSVQSIQGVLLLIVSEIIFNGMYQVIHIFPSEIEICVREKSAYAALPYFLSKIFSLIPFGIIHSLGFLLIYFICLQFLSSVNLFVEMYLILLGASLGGSALGLCLSALFPSIESIHLFIVPLELLCLLLSGLWIKIDTLPRVFSVVKYFSPFYVSFESLSIVYWMKINGTDLCSEVKDIACFHNGTEVLDSYDFIPSYDKVLGNFMFLFLMISVYCYIGYIGILRKRALCNF